MRKIIILLSVALVIILVSTFVIACPAKPAGPVVLKMASAAMAEYTIEEQAFADAFNARAGPDYTIEYYGSQTLVSFPELLDAVRTGTAEMGVLTPNAHAADEPKLGAVELPFLFNNVEANAYAAPKIEPLYGKILEEEFNQKLLCLHQYTGLELFSTRPIKTLEDWKGLLCQALSPVCSGLIEALGGSAVAIPYTESYEALGKKVVDAVITAPAAARIFKVYEVAPYMSKAYYISASHGFSINLDAWNKLPKNIQKIMLEEAQKSSQRINDWLISEWQNDLNKLTSLGVNIYVVPQAEVDRWKEASRPFFESELAKMGDVGEKVVEIANEANSKYPR